MSRHPAPGPYHSQRGPRRWVSRLATTTALLGCGTASLEPSTTPVSVVSTIPDAPASAASTQAMPQPRGPSPLGLIDAEGWVVLHIDFEKFPSIVGRVAEVAFFDDLRVEGHRLVEVAEVCDTNLDQLVDVLAMSISPDEDALVVARSTKSRRLEHCVRTLLKGTPATRFEGLDGLRFDEESLVVFHEDLVVYGRGEAVARALARLRGQSPRTTGGMVAQVTPTRDAVAMVLEVPSKGRGWLRVRGNGQGLRVEGEVQPSDGLSPSERRRELSNLERRRDRLRHKVKQELAELFGETHPILTRWGREVVPFSRKVGLQWSFPLSALREADVTHAVERHAREQTINEVKNNIGAIARGAMAAYEHRGKLCGDATAVPAAVPAGVSYPPNTTRGADFNTGDAGGGWRCVRFNMTQPVRYRYAYRQGARYIGPARGLPDPGPHGFEVSAEGDLDGDGKTSLFTITAELDAASRLRVDRRVNESDPHE